MVEFYHCTLLVGDLNWAVTGFFHYILWHLHIVECCFKLIISDVEEADPDREVADEVHPDRDLAAPDDLSPPKNPYPRVPATLAPNPDLNPDLHATSQDLHKSRDLDPVPSLRVTPDRNRSRNPREGRDLGRRTEQYVKSLWEFVESRWRTMVGSYNLKPSISVWEATNMLDALLKRSKYNIAEVVIFRYML